MQSHLQEYFKLCNDQESQVLKENLESLDYSNLQHIFQKAHSPPAANPQLSNIPFASSSDPLASKWYDHGLDLISKNEVGIILLAGGQGTRLGSSSPKGMYNIDLPSQKSLFQLQTERIVKLQQLAQARATTKVCIPFYVMTSEPTRKETESFFKAKEYFGLEGGQIVFFNQGVLPAFDFQGNILMENKTTPVYSPDGNGGIYKALQMEGVIADMEKKGVKHIHCYCVDNCLVKVGDPTFVGYCAQNECDVAAKCIPKTSPEEQVGLIMAKNGNPSVIEYSELSKTLSELRNDDGQLVYGCANIANHYYTLEFLKRIENFENELEYHIARKKIKHMLPDGSIVTPSEPNGIKLELFIFDVFPFAQKFGLLMVERSQEFSPLKNKSGQDSPETSRQDIINKHVQMVEKAGGIVTLKDGKKQVEVSPLVSYDGEGLESLKGKEVGLTVDSL